MPIFVCVYIFLIVLTEKKGDQTEMKRIFYIPCITFFKKSFQDLKSHQDRIGYVRNWLGVTWGE